MLSKLLRLLIKLLARLFNPFCALLYIDLSLFGTKIEGMRFGFKKILFRLGVISITLLILFSTV